MVSAEANPSRPHSVGAPPPHDGRDGGDSPPHGEGEKNPPFIARMEGVPMDLVLTTLRGRVRIEVEEVSGESVVEAAFSVDGGPARPLARAGRRLHGHLDANELEEGAHTLELHATMMDGSVRTSSATFRVRQGSP